MVAHRLISPTVRRCHSILAYELHHVTEILAWVHTYVATATGKKKKNKRKYQAIVSRKRGTRKVALSATFFCKKKNSPPKKRPLV